MSWMLDFPFKSSVSGSTTIINYLDNLEILNIDDDSNEILNIKDDVYVILELDD